MRWCLVALAACGRIDFGVRADVAGDSHASDGLVVTGDGMVSGCIDPGNGDTFPGGMPCAGWGTPTTVNGTLTESNGTLAITLAPSTNNAAAYCTSGAVPFTAAGVFAEVSMVSGGGSTFLSVADAVGALGAFSLSAVDGQYLAPEHSGDAPNLLPYDAVADRWWRMRPVGTEVEFETSPDGIAYTHFYTSLHAPPSTITIEIGANEPSGTPTPGTTTFESVDTCP